MNSFNLTWSACGDTSNVTEIGFNVLDNLHYLLRYQDSDKLI